MAVKVTAVVAVALLALLPVGCEGQATRTSDEDSTAPEDTTRPEDTEMTDGTEATPAGTDYRAAEVREAIRGVSAALRTQRLTPRFANAGYLGCAGGEADTLTGAKYAYRVQGRADYYFGESGSLEEARGVVSALTSAGWTPRDDDWADNGIHALNDDRWSIYARKDGLEARLEMYATDAVVLMSVTGPCISPPDGTEPSLASKDFKLPGMVPLTNGPTDDENGNLLPGR